MVLLRKVTARVFGAVHGSGGNPLTIFAPAAGSALGVPPALEKGLAKSCQWESAFIDGDTSVDGVCNLKFFAPSGSKLAFCAHAAIGASFAIQKSRDSSAPATISFQTSDESRQTARVDGDHVFLELQNVSYKESHLPLMNADSLLDQCGSQILDALSLPINLAVLDRTKSMIQVSLDVLQKTVKCPEVAKAFADNCMFAGQTTGLFLYSPVGSDWSPEVDVFGRYECRQFPRKSGYPEDPATGIAAAALAVYLSRRHQVTPTAPDDGVWKFRQGTVMGRPSIITIQNIEHNKAHGTVSLECGGRVEIDSEEEMLV